jgi:hypothetical protein
MRTPEGLPSGASRPSQKGRIYRTDRALAKPDISSATDIRRSITCGKSELELSLPHEQFISSACQIVAPSFRGRFRDDKIARKKFVLKIACNPLISRDSDERIQGNPSFSNPQNLGFSQRNRRVPRKPKPADERRRDGRRAGAKPTLSEWDARLAALREEKLRRLLQTAYASEGSGSSTGARARLELSWTAPWPH